MGNSITDIRKKITETHEFISTSYHESGHIVYSLLHFIKVFSASVFEDKETTRIHGNTTYDYPINLEELQDYELLNTFLRIDIGINYAGLIAEKILFQSTSGSKQTPLFIIEGSSEDNKAARLLFKKYNLAPPGSKRANYKKKLQREIYNELYLHWNAITVISHALYQKHKLDFDDLKILLTKKTENKHFWKEQFKKINSLYNQLDENNLKFILLES